MMDIYAASGRGLGDCWASVNYCARRGRRRPVVMSDHYTHPRHGIRKMGPLLREIIAALGCGDRVEVFPDVEPTIQLRWDMTAEQHPYLNTLVRWRSCVDGPVGYQFNGRSKPQITNPPPDHIAKFLARRPGAIRLGLPLTLAQSIDILAGCSRFIGVDSGLAHVACSVGLPVTIARYLRQQKDVAFTYMGQKFEIVDTLEGI